MTDTEKTNNTVTIDILHKKSDNFVSRFATGAIVNGPGPSSQYSIIFHIDCYEIDKETISLDATTKQLSDRVFHDGFYKEDLARIMMTKEKLIELKALIENVLDKTKKDTENKSE